MVQQELVPSYNSGIQPEVETEETRLQKELEAAIKEYNGPLWASIYNSLTYETYTAPLPDKLRRLQVEVYESVLGYALSQSATDWYTSAEEAILSALTIRRDTRFTSQNYFVGADYLCELCQRTGARCPRCVMHNEDADFGW